VDEMDLNHDIGMEEPTGGDEAPMEECLTRLERVELAEDDEDEDEDEIS